jgi:ketopantoate reductase
MRILIIGAGAVGLVVGRALEQNKANEVSYYVRAGRKASLQPIKLLDAKTGELAVRERPAVFEPGDRLPVVDAVFLAVRGDQLDEALAVVATLEGAPAVVSAAAGFDALAPIRARFPGRAVVELVPLFLGYPDGDTVRWWSPPLARSLLTWDGDEAARPFAVALAADLNAGRLPARAVRWVKTTQNALNAAGMPLLVSWQLAGWDLDALAGDRALRRLAASAIPVALRAMEARGAAAGLIRLLPCKLVAAGLGLVPRLMPRNHQEMWRVHGPKIAGQTRLLLGTMAERAGADAGPLDELRRRLDAHAAK